MFTLFTWLQDIRPVKKFSVALDLVVAISFWYSYPADDKISAVSVASRGPSATAEPVAG